jgi:hypothetical protein
VVVQICKPGHRAHLQLPADSASFAACTSILITGRVHGASIPRTSRRYKKQFCSAPVLLNTPSFHRPFLGECPQIRKLLFGRLTKSKLVPFVNVLISGSNEPLSTTYISTDIQSHTDPEYKRLMSVALAVQSKFSLFPASPYPNDVKLVPRLPQAFH